MKNARSYNTVTLHAAGTTFDGRQAVLRHMILSPKNGSIAVKLVRESDNAYDRNAILVKAYSDAGLVPVGYVPRHVAARIAPLMDKGVHAYATNGCVVGGYRRCPTFGFRFDLKIQAQPAYATQPADKAGE